MGIETIAIDKIEARTSKNGKSYHVVSPGGEFVWDEPVADQIAGALAGGATRVTASVDRSNAKFPKITEVAGDSLPPAAAGGASAPAAAAAPSASGAGARGSAPGSYKKDPLGILLGARQTSLNAAVAFHGDKGTAREVVATAEAFAKFILRDMDERLDMPERSAAPANVDDGIPF